MVVGETQHFRKPPKTLLGSILGDLLLKPQIHHRFLQLFPEPFASQSSNHGTDLKIPREKGGARARASGATLMSFMSLMIFDE